MRKKFPKELEKLVKKTTRDLAAGAKQGVQGQKYGTGRLSNDIHVKHSGMTGEVFTTVEHAPFVEFGTGSGFKAPNEMRDVAKKFKVSNPFTGRRRINIKGVGWRMVQFPLNLKARPYFWPHYFVQRHKFYEATERLIQRL